MESTRFTSLNKVRTVKAGRINDNLLWDPEWRVEGVGGNSCEDSDCAGLIWVTTSESSSFLGLRSLPAVRQICQAWRKAEEHHRI